MINLCIPNGKGKMLYSNGDFENGIFQKGIFQKGAAKYNIKGNIYEGEFIKINNEFGPNLSGKIIYSNGNIYEGAWVFL